MSRTSGLPPDPDDPLLKTHDSVNPYRTGMGLILRRLLWDIRPVAWRSAQKLRSCHDIRTGERAVIYCNGPSLNNVDFDLLDGVFVFGLNKIDLIFSKTSMRPDAIVAVNSCIIEQNKPFY